MKVVNIINVILQGLGLLITLVSMFFCYSESSNDSYGNRHMLESEAIIIGIAFIFVGGYQFMHAFVMSILKLVQKEFNWLLGIYWILGVVYIIGWFVIFAMTKMNSFGDDGIFMAIILAWVPVLYYFVISIIDMVRSLKK